MILPMFRRRSHLRNIRLLYGAIVAQARSPIFYAGYGVPDTVDGRFDLLVLHMVLLLRRMEGHDGAGRDFGQALFDTFCRDLDGNLREMGTGDLAVPKRMRQFAEAFYGRQAAYFSALSDTDQGVFEKALARNIFQSVELNAGTARLAQYARASLQQLERQTDPTLLSGKVIFPDPGKFRNAST